ncbi:MAG: hypothetical protein AAGN66_15340 [Acidobacteriota bacterium]
MKMLTQPRNRAKLTRLVLAGMVLSLLAATVQAGEDPDCQVCTTRSGPNGVSVQYCDAPPSHLAAWAFKRCNIVCSGIFFPICYCLVAEACGDPLPLENGRVFGSDEEGQAYEARLTRGLVESLGNVDPYVAALLDRPLVTGEFSGRLQPSVALHADGLPADAFPYRLAQWVDGNHASFELEIDQYPGLTRVSGQIWAEGQAIFLEVERADGGVEQIHLQETPEKDVAFSTGR